MSQFSVWEREYKDSKLITKIDAQSGDLKRFSRWAKKKGELRKNIAYS